PVEDEGRLNDPKLREHFIEHVFVFSRWRRMVKEGGTPGLVVDFHTRHKMLLMTHSRELYDEMGKLTAKAGKMEPELLRSKYFRLLDKAMREKTTINKNVNVLQHLTGYFKQNLTPDEKKEFQEILNNYHQGYLPLIVPITLLNHFVRKYNEPYLQYQYYLNPHPIEFKLRNQA
ncbi:MAG: YbgA family protein, partial [Thermodesulfobacteriota bacterium]